MKKIFTLMLALLAMNGVANADDYLKGNWDSYAGSAFSYTGSVGTVSVDLSANTKYWYYIATAYNGDKREASGNMYAYNCTSWTFDDTSGDYTSILTGPAGTYTFTISWSGDNPVISVSYPSAHETTVHFDNSLEWGTVMAYHSAKADGAQENRLSSAWPGDVLSANTLNSTYYDVSFTDYTNNIDFNNGKIGNGNQTFDKTVDQTASEYWVTWSEGENPTASITSTKPDGWIDYQRGSLTADNLGTICLPYAAKVVSGGSVYKIASKVMKANGTDLAYVNLTAVDALEAGHAYIFQADGTELNIQYTGTEAADAADADGMKGNLAADPATVAKDNYVLGGNLLHKVTGDGVTAAQNRAWITLTGIGEAAARGQFYIGFADESTGIENVKGNENGNAPIYNLNGQRVKSAANGLYIQNGRKYIVK